MHTLRPFLPFCAVLTAATLLAQQEIPPPPRTPANPPPNPSFSNEPKVAAPTGATASKSSARSAPMRVATPIPAASTPKPGLWKRMFGRDKGTEPVTKPGKEEPAATPKSKAKAKPAEKTSTPKLSTPEPEEKPKMQPDEPKATPVPKATPQPKATPTPKPAATPKSNPAVAPSKATPAPAPTAGADEETVERYKFAEAKRKALEDSALQDLKLKADTTPSEADARKALRTYNKALFQKMKKIDPSISERIDATEAAILKRLGGE